jgi:hypothetical protein
VGVFLVDVRDFSSAIEILKNIGVNLVAEHAAGCASFLRDALQQVQDLGTLSSRSIKFRNAFKQAVTEGEGLKSFTDNHVHTVKPLCPTRWLCRVSPVSFILQHYDSVLTSLETMTSLSNGETAAKSSGLLEQFRKGVTILGLKVAVAIFTLLELLNRSLQSEMATVSGMLKAVENVIAELNDLRNAETFHYVMNDVDRMVDSHGLYEVCVPRVRRPPRRYFGPAEAHESRRGISRRVLPCCFLQCD